MSSRYQAEIDMSDTGNTHTMLVSLVGENKRVLELGAASGYMTATLKKRGCEVVAVEFDPAAADELAHIADIAVIGDLNDRAVLAGIDGPFDVVLAGDVLEHLMDPLTVLKDAVAKLADGGSVVISIPNIGHVDVRLALLQGRFEYRETGLLDATHIRFFTFDTFIELLAEAGLMVVELRRSVVLAFESELEVQRDSVSAPVLRAAMSVPESETYQFVVSAMVDTGDADLRALSEMAIDGHRRLEQAHLDGWPDRAAAADVHRQLDTVQHYLTDAEHDRDFARERLTAAQQEVAALTATAVELRADADGLRAELLISRSELQAACIEESLFNSLTKRYEKQFEELQQRTQEVADTAHERISLRVELDAAYFELEALRGREARAKESAGTPGDPRQLHVIVDELIATRERVERESLAVREELNLLTGSRAHRLITRYRRVVGRIRG